MPTYRTILVVITVLSLVITGLGQVRNSLILTLGMINLCGWAYALVDKWIKQRNALPAEAERHLRVGNYVEAEKALTLSLKEAELQRRSVLWRVRTLRHMSEAQRKQSKFAQAE